MSSNQLHEYLKELLLSGSTESVLLGLDLIFEDGIKNLELLKVIEEIYKNTDDENIIASIEEKTVILHWNIQFDQFQNPEICLLQLFKHLELIPNQSLSYYRVFLNSFATKYNLAEFQDFDTLLLEIDEELILKKIIEILYCIDFIISEKELAQTYFKNFPNRQKILFQIIFGFYLEYPKAYLLVKVILKRLIKWDNENNLYKSTLAKVLADNGEFSEAENYYVETIERTNLLKHRLELCLFYLNYQFIKKALRLFFQISTFIKDQKLTASIKKSLLEIFTDFKIDIKIQIGERTQQMNSCENPNVLKELKNEIMIHKNFLIEVKHLIHYLNK